MLRSEVNLQGKSKQSFIAFYLADAGIERALFYLSLNTGLATGEGDSFTLGNHSVIWEIASPTSDTQGNKVDYTYLITGTGRVLNANSNIMAQRVVQSQAVLHYVNGSFDSMERAPFAWKGL
jgi:hypothetical protein